MTDKIILATHNVKKAAELEHELGELFEIVCASALNLPEPEETGETFIENALLKATLCCERTGMLSLADDSGLCIEALGGKPGIYSARWADVLDNGQRDFTKAFQRIQEQLENASNRGAYMVCALACVWPNGEKVIVEGRVYGEIVHHPRGTKNFGYDPLFQPDGYDQTFAEMEPSFKASFSHRTRAVEKMKCILGFVKNNEHHEHVQGRERH